MNLEKLFDLIVNTAEDETANAPYTIGVDVDKKPVVLRNVHQKVAVIRRGIQSFMYNGTGTVVNPWASPEKRRRIQAFGGSTGLPITQADVFNVTTQTPHYDTAWQAAYKAIPLKKGQMFWEIFDVTGAMTFDLIPEGGKVKYYSVTGSGIKPSVNKYGMGVVLTWEMIEGRKLYQFVEMMELAQANLFKLWADLHYGLMMESLTTSGNTVDYQLTATDRPIDRVIATLNEAYNSIADANLEKGYGDMANVEMLFYVDTKYKSLVNAALRVTNETIATSGSGPGVKVEFNVTPLYTKNSTITADKGIIVLPGHKIQNAAYLRYLKNEHIDAATLSKLQEHWTVFGGAIGDSDQLSLVDLTD